VGRRERRGSSEATWGGWRGGRRPGAWAVEDEVSAARGGGDFQTAREKRNLGAVGGVGRRAPQQLDQSPGSRKRAGAGYLVESLILAQDQRWRRA